MNETKQTRPPGQHSPQNPLEQAQIRKLMTRNFEIDRWRVVATTAGFPIESLPPAAVEILDMIQRVIIDGHGWNRNDKLKGLHASIPLSPQKLSKNGQKKCPRTYQRAIKELHDLSLLMYCGTGSDQVRIFSPSWWVVDSIEEAQEVWRQAYLTLQKHEDDSPLCRSEGAATTTSCRSVVTPPVTDKSPPTFVRQSVTEEEV